MTNSSDSLDHSVYVFNEDIVASDEDFLFGFLFRLD